MRMVIHRIVRVILHRITVGGGGADARNSASGVGARVVNILF